MRRHIAASPVGATEVKIMGHTYTQLVGHIVFSTKERRRFIDEPVAERLVPYIGGILRERSGKLVSAHAMPDHMHLLAVLSPRFAVSDQVRDIKSLSSAWIHNIWPNQKTFCWQEGYSAFSVAKSDIPAVQQYIEQQEVHHRTKTFEEELIAIVGKSRDRI